MAMTQLDSGLLRELDCVESRVLAWSGRWHPRGIFSKVELASVQGLRVCSDLVQLSRHSSEEERVEMGFVPTEGASPIDQKGAGGVQKGYDCSH